MGKCIQKLREERGWSLEELAGRILLSPEELKCMENGIKEPDKMTVTLLGYILNVHADSLLNGEIHCRVSQTELMELMKETIDYLEGIQKENKQIGVDMEKIQEKYGMSGKDMPEIECTERMQKQGHIFTNKIQKESVPKLL